MWPWSPGKGQLGIHACYGSADILCTPSGSVSTGWLRTGASLDLHCRANSEKVTQETHLILNSLTVNIWHNLIPQTLNAPLPRPGPMSGMGASKEKKMFICECGHVLFCSRRWLTPLHCNGCVATQWHNLKEMCTFAAPPERWWFRRASDNTSSQKVEQDKACIINVSLKCVFMCFYLYPSQVLPPLWDQQGV